MEDGVVRLRFRRQRRSRKKKEQTEAVKAKRGVETRWLGGGADVGSCRDGMAREIVNCGKGVETGNEGKYEKEKADYETGDEVAFVKCEM